MTSYQRELTKLGLILCVAIAVRLLAIPFISPIDANLDNLTYQNAASDIIRNGFISNNFIMPLYPLVLALLGGGAMAQTLVGFISGIASVILVWALARCFFKDKLTGLVAAMMIAIYPMAIFYSVLGLTESLFVVLVLGAFLSLYKNKPILASVLFILSILTRPIMDLFAPFVIFWHAFVVRKVGLNQTMRELGVYGTLYVLLMAPWWYHNYEKHGDFVRLNHGFGVVLYSGNNAMNKSGGGIGGKDYDISSFNNISDALERDHALRNAGIEYIRQNPGKFVTMAWVKFVRFWRLLPYTPQMKGNVAAIIATMSMLPLILLAILTLIKRRKMILYFTPVLGFAAYLTLVHMITIGSVRYRFPIEPFLIVLAAPSLIFIWETLFARRTRTEKRK